MTHSSTADNTPPVARSDHLQPQRPKGSLRAYPRRERFQQHLQPHPCRKGPFHQRLDRLLPHLQQQSRQRRHLRIHHRTRQIRMHRKRLPEAYRTSEPGHNRDLH